MEQLGIFVELIPYSVATYCNLPSPSLADYKRCQSKKELEELEVDEDYERAINHVEFFVDWLWGISKNKVGVTNFLISSRRRRNFKLLRSTPQRLHHGVY